MLGFVGRRLLAEAVVLLFAVREVGERAAVRRVVGADGGGARREEARGLLTAAVPGHLDERVRDRIVAETRGNPLGLLESAGGLSEAELAGGFGVPQPAPVAGGLEEHYLRRVRALRESARRLMVLAAADPTGDATLLWRAAKTLGLGRDTAAAECGAATEIGSRVRFRHPLVRSAAYAAASDEDRRAAHLALAAATDIAAAQQTSSLRYAPNRSGTSGVASGCCGDRTGRGGGQRAGAVGRQGAGPGRAGGRGGVPGTVGRVDGRSGAVRRPSVGRRRAHLYAGGFDTALGLLAQAEADAVDALQRARVEQLEDRSTGHPAPVGRRRCGWRRPPGDSESLDARLARDTYLAALFASFVAGRSGADPVAISSRSPRRQDRHRQLTLHCPVICCWMV